MDSGTRSARAAMPREIYALFVVRLVVSAGSFVGPFLAMMLTLKLGYDEAGAGAFMSAVSVVSALGLVLGGKLGDTFGRAAVLRNLQAATAAIFLVCAAAGFTVATPFLIALAMGTLSGSWPVINALVADHAPPDRRKEAFSLLYWGNNIGFSIGPLVAGFLFNAAPRILFVGNAVVLLAAAATVTLFVDRHGAKPAESGTDLGSAATPGTELETAAARGTELDPAATPGTELDGRPTTLWSVMRANPVLLLFGLAQILTAFVYNQHTFALPVFLADSLGAEAGPRAYGMVMTTNGLTVVVLTAFVTWVSRRLPSLAAVAGASVFYAVGFGAYWFVGGLPVALGATALWTVGEILGATNSNAFIAERAPPAHRSRVNSAISLCHIVGNAAAPLAAGPLAKALGSRAVWPFVAVLALASAASMAWVHRFDMRRNGTGAGKAA